MPKVSIVIAVYNVPESFLNQCINSCIAQTMKDIEILIVDDGSSKEYAKKLDAFCNIDSRIRVLHKQNGGTSSTRNEGLLKSNGEWILFVDGDDWIDKETCELTYAFGNEKNLDIVMFGMIKEYSKTSLPYPIDLRESYIYKDDDCKKLQCQVLNYNSNIATQANKLYKKRFLVDNNLWYDEELKQSGEGVEFNLRVFEKLKRTAFINKPFYHYRYNECSVTSTYSEEYLNTLVDTFSKISTYVRSNSGNEELMRFLNNRITYVISASLISGYFNPQNSEKYASKCKKCDAFLDNEIFKNAFINPDLKNVDLARRMVFFFAKYHIYFLIQLIAIIRKKQKTIS